MTPHHMLLLGNGRKKCPKIFSKLVLVIVGYVAQLVQYCPIKSHFVIHTCDFSSISELIHSLLSSGQVLKDDHMHGETCSQYGGYLCLRTVCTKCTRESRNFIQSFHAKQEALPAQQDTFGSTNVVTMQCSTPEPPNPGPAVPDKSISNVCLTGGHFHT